MLDFAVVIASFDFPCELVDFVSALPNRDT